MERSVYPDGANQFQEDEDIHWGFLESTDGSFFAESNLSLGFDAITSPSVLDNLASDDVLLNSTAAICSALEPQEVFRGEDLATDAQQLHLQVGGCPLTDDDDSSSFLDMWMTEERETSIPALPGRVPQLSVLKVEENDGSYSLGGAADASSLLLLPTPSCEPLLQIPTQGDPRPQTAATRRGMGSGEPAMFTRSHGRGLARNLLADSWPPSSAPTSTPLLSAASQSMPRPASPGLSFEARDRPLRALDSHTAWDFCPSEFYLPGSSSASPSTHLSLPPISSLTTSSDSLTSLPSFTFSASAGSDSQSLPSTPSPGPGPGHGLGPGLALARGSSLSPGGSLSPSLPSSYTPGRRRKSRAKPSPATLELGLKQHQEELAMASPRLPRPRGEEVLPFSLVKPSPIDGARTLGDVNQMLLRRSCSLGSLPSLPPPNSVSPLSQDPLPNSRSVSFPESIRNVGSWNNLRPATISSLPPPVEGVTASTALEPNAGALVYSEEGTMDGVSQFFTTTTSETPRETNRETTFHITRLRTQGKGSITIRRSRG